MKVRGGTLDVLPPSGDTSRPIDDQPSEVRRIGARLAAIVAQHVESSRAMTVPVSAEDLRAVIAALDAEADGLAPAPHVHCPDEVRVYLRQSLYEELLGEPSNVFYASRVDAETMRYEPMPREFWKECLAALSGRLRLDELNRD